MIKTSNAEIKGILIDEMRAVNAPVIALHNANIEIGRLKKKLENPTFHDLGEKHAFHPPETYLVDSELETWMEVNNRMMQMEINNIASFFMTTVMSVCVCAGFALLIIW
tara:strand:- start:130 stop:456 length:327 start_codon:yes stop_codon:yes gene_type:complete